MLYVQNQKILPADANEEFLPPISPWTSLLGILLMATVGSAIALSWWIKYDVVVKAAATVRPVGDVRLVQPEMAGTVESVLVTENQVVKRGDPIAQLDTDELQIKQSLLQGNIQQGKLQLIQMDAQISTLDTQILAETRLIERTIASAQADLSRNQRDYQERKITTESEYLAAEANVQKALANLQKAQADLEFAKADRDRYQQLAEIGAIGRREYEQKKLVVEQAKSFLAGEKQAVEIAQAQLQSAQAAINPSMATVAIATERIAQERAKGEASIATLNKEKQILQQRKVEMQSQLNQYQKELQQVDKQLQSSVIRATSDGVILKLNLRNPGQVVRASEPIAEIVPQNTPLVVKAMIPTADIKKVAIGQKVQLRVAACPYPDYGTLQAVVSAISPDAIAPQRHDTNTTTASAMTPTGSYFEATIKPENSTFGHGNKSCQILSGMNADANIISQQETALQFILRKARLITDL
ncbi:HlyD family efflux transporter periplasmic adaptor subunit [Anabaena sp. CA = ATCC 33047]|uniref:HlyD family efflux transporter periplasmic adaptor subunit n=1 Tax=Anabaena sp. (strain CA / ATCC 33047) TaxID=52271 RepID=UPI000829C561|nr:HlyD family efflux transporter periplasmic adaptor subunit [Anabaena sp. CA = ATCC 33047]